VGKIDDVKQTKDDGQTQAQDGVEGTIHQTQQELAQDGRQWDSKKFHGGLFNLQTISKLIF
jgi:hypothetical protein